MDHVFAKDLMKDYEGFQKKFPFNSAMTDFIGRENVIRMNGSEWKMQRTLINPIFGKLSNFFGAMEKKVDQVMERWSKISLDGGFDIGEDVQKMALDVLGVCVFGKDFNFFDGVEKGPLHHYNYFIKSMKNIFIAFMPSWLFYLIPFGKIKNLRESTKIVNEYIKTLEDEALENNEKNSLLTMLVNANTDKKLSKNAIRDNILLFFIAGHETTSTALQYALYELSQNPECQEKLREEVNRVFPNNIDPEGLKDLTYTSNIINESLRLHPPVGILNRRTFEDVNVGEFIVPKDTLISILNYGIQRDPEIWGDDANIFNPDRFNHLTKDQALAQMPFGGGPRICIGNTFSLYEQKIFLAKLIKKFKFTLEPGSQLIVTDMLAQPRSELLKYKFEQIN